MRTFMVNARGPSRYVGALLNKFEDKLITIMAAREGIPVHEMVRQCILREAVRPLFGAPPIDEVIVDAAE